ncbi:RAxF-45 family protein [Alkalihalobacillus sp. R86527]
MLNAVVRTEFEDYASCCRAIIHDGAANGTRMPFFSNFI